MPEPLTISGTVEASYHQFFLLDVDTYPEDAGRLSWQDNGLVTTTTGILAISTGIHTGPARLVVERLSSAPPLTTRTWDDVVETSLHVPQRELRVAGLMQEPSPELRTPVQVDSTLCRVRVHASGRDTAFDVAVSDAVEDYLVQLWETDSDDPDAIMHATSSYGTRMRGH
ncbi:hypothetical protein GCM10027271_46130 [Saccharopolyspora gloriosae]|uniref:Uncharacterized protein n=1 Tax=Saccharopolyspora gloriosae TaxID=455344 RepID=A0A840NCR2_9PSEU|nr:hypothetical protein [Saccharopolyspora gloriosae]MBB5070086.1 hypothetical protein [Saccharopolyspora gloriosae]